MMGRNTTDTMADQKQKAAIAQIQSFGDMVNDIDGLVPHLNV